MTTEEKTEALKLAGKLAMASHKLIRSDVFFLSSNIEELSNALRDYDNFIFEKCQLKK